MVIDTSALIAILFAEEEKDIFLQAIATDSVRLMSASTHTETSLFLPFGMAEKTYPSWICWLRR
ncbi:type II toxin-antitoxin system VapC family toxin [Altericista sp. CCNU0014]|uniref:type II toxin-antitoxin system VapC family toxin n=1 Tax=Altericista sp. CCNU0014 TaxID=3082949 RepID=UPI00384DC106